ncbi:branched-chain amino acid transport system II carrier protein [Winogradskyella aurantia]|uniref:Branched-chain amino acid transport system II carrier protein n=1 Tax=Winogradskyella aurantia TaxID=1915063 RepID=A0A265V070_9FLAO|nr:branched-chain amino acid transport system II carrier protein [Winogradskyella aurantia]OZV70964.1 branched-chain amino acid transport system II carrier protein [Winogradskyella aurantia]
MKHTKRILVFGFALFAGFFGAGNLILPPQIGFKSGSDWWLVALGFLLTTTVIPLMSLFGHAKLQGTILDFGKKVSPKFSLAYCIIMFLIVVAFPLPRTAAVTHEMAIAPVWGTSPLWTSCIYFLLVFLFAANRSKALNLIGKYLTPIIVVMVLLIITIGLTSSAELMVPSQLSSPFVDGLLEGYQTYDAIAGLVMGGVIIISLNAQGFESYTEKRRIIAQSGGIAMLGLFIIYVGLIALGAFYNGQFPADITRTELLLGLSTSALGSIGASFIGVLIALACFTTAVAVVVSVGDFFKVFFKNNERIYQVTIMICCVIGVLVGSNEVGFIIDVALPSLMFIYPISIALIILNILPEAWSSTVIFRGVIITVFVFSIPDFLSFMVPEELLGPLKESIPWSSYNLGWVLPAIIVFFAIKAYQDLRLRHH